MAELDRNVGKEACTDSEAKDHALNGPSDDPPQCNEYLQNECPAVSGPPENTAKECIEMYIKEGPSSELNHYTILASAEVASVSCGFFDMGDGSFWMTQNFYK